MPSVFVVYIEHNKNKLYWTGNGWGTSVEAKKFYRDGFNDKYQQEINNWMNIKDCKFYQNKEYQIKIL